MTEKTDKEIVEWDVYEPLDWQKGLYKVNTTDRCRYSVHDTYGVGFHRCARKSKEIIEGYGFCTQHAKMVKARLGRK